MYHANTKILLVEDTEVTRRILLKMLRRLGFTNITECSDGHLAWAQMELAFSDGRPFELVLSDWKMPEVSGIELLQKLRAHQDLKETPFVMLTSQKAKEQVVQAVQAGVTQYLAKPFSLDILRDKLREVWEIGDRKKKSLPRWYQTF